MSDWGSDVCSSDLKRKRILLECRTDDLCLQSVEYGGGCELRCGHSDPHLAGVQAGFDAGAGCATCHQVYTPEPCILVVPLVESEVLTGELAVLDTGQLHCKCSEFGTVFRGSTLE